MCDASGAQRHATRTRREDYGSGVACAGLSLGLDREMVCLIKIPFFARILELDSG